MINKKQRFVLDRVNLEQTAGVAACLKALTGKDYKFLCGWWEYLQCKYQKHHGIRFSAKRLKEYYNFAVRIALEYPIEDIEALPFTRVNCRGIPKALAPFEKGLKGSIIERRCMLSILNCHEGLTCKPELDLSTITDSTPMLASTRITFRALFKNRIVSDKIMDSGLYLDDIIGPNRMYKSANSGPNGKAVFTAHIDARALAEDPPLAYKVAALLDYNFEGWSTGSWSHQAPSIMGPYRALRNLLRDYKSNIGIFNRTAVEAFDNPKGVFHDFINQGPSPGRGLYMIDANSQASAGCPLKTEFSKGSSHSVIRVIGDKSCKSRVVAIADYWTQLALYPIHKLFFNFLKNIGPCDATFDHDQAAQRVNYWLFFETPVWSFDLTAATDLFPRILSYDLISGFDPDLAKLWYDVISDRDFNIGGRRRHKVRYGRGTPMGLLSSWPVFAVTHHAVVRGCAYLIGIPDFEDYVIIGDDIVIANEAVAKRYRRVMTTNFGCKISEGKSIISSHGVCRGEIAKRIFLRQHELSPLTPNSIREVRSNKNGPKPFKLLMKEVAMLPFFLKKLSARQWFQQIKTDIPAQDMVMNFIDKLYSHNHHRLVRTKFNNAVLSLFSVPGALPADLMKSSPALVAKFKELFGDDFKQSLYIIAMYYSNRTKSLQRAAEDTSAAKYRFASVTNSPYYSNMLGFQLVEHPLLYLFGHELASLKEKVQTLKDLDVTTVVYNGGLRSMDFSVFSEVYIEDEYKTREGDRSRLHLRTLSLLSGKSMRRNKDKLNTIYQSTNYMTYGPSSDSEERSFVFVPKVGLLVRRHNCGRPIGLS